MNQKRVAEVVSFLEQDAMKNISILNFLKNNPVTSLKRMADSVILRGKSDRNWVYISCPDKEQLVDCLSLLSIEDRFFGAIEDWMMPLLIKNRQIVWDACFTRVILPEKESFILHDHIDITPLSPTDAAYLYEHSDYQDLTSAEYISDRIEQGPSAGICDSGRLAAWGLTHDDMAIGTLHVLEAYRNKAYAYHIIRYLSNELRKCGITPFAYITETNVASMNLFQKAGFRKDCIIHWFEIT